MTTIPTREGLCRATAIPPPCRTRRRRHRGTRPRPEDRTAISAYGQRRHRIPASARVLENDTLQAIAQRAYGNNCLWYAIAAANAVTDATLVAGTTLKVPSIKTTANDASTFKPYDPNAIQGPTTPGLPYITPPPKQHCSALAKVLLVVVAIIVTVYTAGTMAGAMGVTSTAAGSTGVMSIGSAALTGGLASTGVAAGSFAAAHLTATAMVAGLVGGAAGSAVSQAVGSAMGVATFSWRNVASTAVTTALTAGLASQFGTVGRAAYDGHWAKAAALAVANAGANAAGRWVSGGGFSWRSVATDAVSSLVSARISKSVGLMPEEAFKSAGGFGADVANGLIGGIVSLHTRRAFGFDDPVNYGNIAVDAFGNAVANAIVSKLSIATKPQSMTQRIGEPADASDSLWQKEINAIDAANRGRLEAIRPGASANYDQLRAGLSSDSAFAIASNPDAIDLLRNAEAEVAATLAQGNAQSEGGSESGTTHVRDQNGGSNAVVRGQNSTIEALKALGSFKEAYDGLAERIHLNELMMGAQLLLGPGAAIKGIAISVLGDELVGDIVRDGQEKIATNLNGKFHHASEQQTLTFMAFDANHANGADIVLMQKLHDDFSQTQTGLKFVLETATTLVVGIGAAKVGRMGGGPGAANGERTGLDWTRPSPRTGGTAAEHVIQNHGAFSLTKPAQGVFYGNPILVTEDAWLIAQKTGLKPVTVGARDIYVVPRPNSGYAGGMGGQLNNFNYVSIFTETGTNRVVTAYPSGGTPPLPKGYDFLLGKPQP